MPSMARVQRGVGRGRVALGEEQERVETRVKVEIVTRVKEKDSRPVCMRPGTSGQQLCLLISGVAGSARGPTLPEIVPRMGETKTQGQPARAC